ncbi:MAG: C/D box methylation guide ribonucleoprotein complex aNOP56 subunit [Candidatus Odinarchaeota archaeon]
MDGFLVFSITSLYCLDERFTILTEKKLGKTPQEVGITIDRLRKGEKDPTIAVFIQELQTKGVKRFFVESQALAEVLTTLYETKTIQYEDIDLWRRARQEFIGSNLTTEKLKTLHDIAIELARQAIREASEQGDQLVIQAMSSLDDVEKVQNLMVSRLREWYGLHFPEAAQTIEDAQILAKIVTEGGRRENIEKNPELIQLLSETPVKPDLLSQSMGADIHQHDMEMIQALSSQLLDLQKLRKQLETYLDEGLQGIAPNLRGLIGPVIGARFITLAGGLEKLARLPASTIQVLGAEQALFRAIKTGARPPKHGIIFQHTMVHSAPWWQRGKIARILAGKIAIAARVDLYSGEYVADELKQSVFQRIAEVKRKYPTAPKRIPSVKPTKHTPRRKKFHRKAKSPSRKKSRSKTKRQK